MNKKYAVKLSETERAHAQAIQSGSETTSRFRKRASVLLLADESAGKPMTQAEIAMRCGVSDVTVYHTIRDYCERGGSISHIASTDEFFQMLKDNNIVNIKPEFLMVCMENLAWLGQMLGYVDRDLERGLYEFYLAPQNKDHRKQRGRTAPNRGWSLDCIAN